MSPPLALELEPLKNENPEEPSVSPSDAPSAEQPETFANSEARPRLYHRNRLGPEFTSLCPKTGQPDFGTITFTYTPAALCVELKSLKLYLQRYRNEGAFYETVVNRLLDDFVAARRPRRCRVAGAFTTRGGITHHRDLFVRRRGALTRREAGSRLILAGAAARR